MRLRLLLILCVVTLVACNLGTPDPTPLPLATPTSASPFTNKPLVSVSSPQNGDAFPVNQPILVNAVATSNEGVTRVQLYANGSPVKTVSSVSPLGDTTLTTTLDYTPRALGTVALRVLAFRGAVSSDPVDITVTVGSTQTQPTPIPIPGSGNNSGGSSGSNVVIPPDGVCRVLTNTGVNLRSAPTTTQNNIINTLAPSTLAPVLARLGDNSWWKVNVNGQVGWVFGQLVTLTGNCFNVPAEAGVTATPTIAPAATLAPTLTTAPTLSGPTVTPVSLRPDLVVTTIFGATSLTLSGGTVSETYSITITNVGVGSAGPFSASSSLNNGTSVDIGSVSGLMPGQSVVLTRTLQFTSANTYNLRVDIDPANTVAETSDLNNRGDITIVVTN